MNFIKILFIIAIIYGIIGFVSKLQKNGTKFPNHFMILIVGIIGLLLSSLIIKVDAQQVGVKVTPTGVDDQELLTGWHIVAPWSNVYKMDKTVWVYTCADAQNEGAKANADAIWAPTKDGIKMGIDVSVSWRIIPEEASWIYQNVTNETGKNGRYHWLEENVIRAKLKSALALTVSNYTPIEVYSVKREEIQTHVLERMKKEIKSYKISINQIDIREVYYNKEYEQAINNKKLAEQEALRLIEVTKQKEEKLLQSKIDKDIAIQYAEGEAKALQIKGNAINANPKIIKLEWINKWDGQLPTYMMGKDNGIILNVNK